MNKCKYAKESECRAECRYWAEGTNQCCLAIIDGFDYEAQAGEVMPLRDIASALGMSHVGVYEVLKRALAKVSRLAD